MVCHKTLLQPLQIAFYSPVTAKQTSERILTDLTTYTILRTVRIYTKAAWLDVNPGNAKIIMKSTWDKVCMTRIKGGGIWLWLTRKSSLIPFIALVVLSLKRKYQQMQRREKWTSSKDSILTLTCPYSCSSGNSVATSCGWSSAGWGHTHQFWVLWNESVT